MSDRDKEAPPVTEKSPPPAKEVDTSQLTPPSGRLVHDGFTLPRDGRRILTEDK